MPDFFTLLLLITAAFFAGLIDAVAGGGGLITVPVLMGIGLPPQVALGTNKLQASFGSGSAMLHFVRSGTVKLSDCISGIIWTGDVSQVKHGTHHLLDLILIGAAVPNHRLLHFHRGIFGHAQPGFC